ncbi:MAG: hypothetical protein ACHQF2_09860 [Flavobacteriales bacterium]
METVNRHKEGEVVYAKTKPGVKLVIRRYIDRIYYCQVEGDSKQREQVYFERELLTEAEAALVK